MQISEDLFEQDDGYRDEDTPRYPVSRERRCTVVLYHCLDADASAVTASDAENGQEYYRYPAEVIIVSHFFSSLESICQQQFPQILQ
jgi:hypothetical protein